MPFDNPQDFLTQKQNDAEIKKLMSQLGKILGPEGFSFSVEDEPLDQYGFRRLFVNRGGNIQSAQLFVDIRMGPHSPAGRVVEMASSKPGTYGMPGFARHVMGEDKLSSTTETFADFLRSVYERAGESKKTPQQSLWHVYQHGYGKHRYPGAGEEVEPDKQAWGVPAAGAVLDPSASSGKRQYTANIIRFWTPETIRTQRDIEEQYLNPMMKRMLSGGFPMPEQRKEGEAKKGDLGYLMGYGPNIEKTAWIPITTQEMVKKAVQGVTEPQWTGFAPRPSEQFKKSYSTGFEARELANVPMVRDKGKLKSVQASMPEEGAGLRGGWTRSSVVLPNELEPRNVLAKMVALGDQPDLPGSAYASKSAFDILYGGQQKGLYSIGSRGNVLYEMGVRTVQELLSLVKDRNLKFYNLEGQEESGGGGMIGLGGWDVPVKSEETGKTEMQHKGLIRVDRKGYDIRLHKPTLHIPEYYYTDVDEKTGKSVSVFSNMPMFDEQGNPRRTDEEIRFLRKKYGEFVNVAQYSSIGTGTKDDPAGVYLTAPIDRITPISMKTSGMKAGLQQLTENMYLEYLGGDKKVPIDFYTQEGKIPARALMSSFGIMNKQTQLAFIDEFLPGKSDTEKLGIEAIKKVVLSAYEKNKKAPAIFVDEMADKYSSATGKTISADMLFSTMFKNILNTRTPEKGKEIFDKFRIGLPIEQFLEGQIYSADQKVVFEQLIAKASEEVPDIDKLIKFERLKRDPAIEKAITDQGGDPDAQMRELYRMKFKVPGGGGSVILPMGTSFVPEYPSQSSFMNAKAIMAIIDRYPKAAKEMGMTNEKGDWAGPYGAGNVDPSVKGWNEMFYWLGFQSDIRDFNKDRVLVPGDSVTINPENPELASRILEYLDLAKAMPSDKEKLEFLRDSFKTTAMEGLGYGENTNLEDSYIVETSTGTIIPKISSVLDIESFKSGVQEGETRTYYGSKYLAMLEATMQSAVSTPGAQYRVAAQARDSFYNRIAGAFSTAGQRNKNIMRNIIGMNVPGTRGGRFAGMTQLEIGEAFASDDYLRKMLANSGFKSREDIISIMQYLNTGVDAYLPVLFQRYPDMSGKHQELPMKIRSVAALKKLGVPVPEGAASRDLFFMYAGAGALTVGDWDADPGQQKVLPISDVHNRKHTGVWKMPAATQRDFDSSFRYYQDNMVVREEVLKGLFGNNAFVGDYGPLDVDVKNLRDYGGSFTGKDKEGNERPGRPSLSNRVMASGTYPHDELLKAANDLAFFKSHMGPAYNARYAISRIIPSIAGISDDDEEIRQRAEEAGAAPYQMYLDQMKKALGDGTQLEAMFNTFGVYKPVDDGKGKVTGYNVRIKLSEQDDAKYFEDTQVWPRVSAAGDEYPRGLLGRLMSKVSAMDEFKESNAKLAFGWASMGNYKKNASIIYNALENPMGFYTSPLFTQGPDAKPNYWKELQRLGVFGDRTQIMRDALRLGLVGYNSPYYRYMVYRAVNRAENKYPQYFEDPNLKLPWITGEMTPISEIKKSPDFQKLQAADRLFMSGTGLTTPEDMEILSQITQGTFGKMMQGIMSTYKQATGGTKEYTGGPENEVISRARMFERERQLYTLGQDPVIHASEIGAAVGGVSAEMQKSWTKAPESQWLESSYAIALRAMGLGHLMSGREQAQGTAFIRERVDTEFEAISGGQSFESAFAASEKSKGLTHVGQVPTEDVLEFKVGGATIRGTPDFIGYRNGKFVIRDTKSPQESWEGKPYTEEYAVEKTKKYRYRMQQIAYAYGLEEKANTLDQENWRRFMNRWGVTDNKQIDLMQLAARRGEFDIALQPGRVNPSTNELETFREVPIPYASEEQGKELETAVRSVVGSVFEPTMFRGIAQETYSALRQPAFYNKTDPRTGEESRIQNRASIPSHLRGFWIRNADPPDIGAYSILQKIAGASGVSFGGQSSTFRASGGGRFDDVEGKRIRVGEGGPEELIIGDKGEVSVVPTSELTESKVARGEGDPQEGYLGARKSDGEISMAGTGNPNDPSIQKKLFEENKEKLEALGWDLPSLSGTNPETIQTYLSEGTQNPAKQLQQEQYNRPFKATAGGGIEKSGAPLEPFSGGEKVGELIVSPKSGGEVRDVQSYESVMQAQTEQIDILNQSIKQLTEAGKLWNVSAQSMPSEITHTFTGSGRMPNELKIARNLFSSLSIAGSSIPKIQAFQKQVSDIMIDAFKQGGMADKVEGLGYEGGPNANELILRAQQLGLDPKYYEPKLGALLKEARGVQLGVSGIIGAQTVMSSQKVLTDELLARSPQFAENVERVRQFAAANPQDTEGKELSPELIEAGSAAQFIVKRGASLGGKYAGTEEMIERLSVSSKKASDAMDALAKATEEGRSTKKEEIEVAKTSLQVDKDELTLKAKRYEEASRGLMVGGQYVSAERRAELYAAGQVGPEQEEAAAQARGLYTRAAGISVKQAELDQPDLSLKSLGAISRRMLGGFGLMYLRSIGGIMMGPGATGYEQGMTQMAGAEQALGSRLGGYAPMITPESRIQRMETLYGGLGMRTLRNAYANILEEQPGLAFTGGMAQAGVGGFGLAAFTLGMMGVTGPAGMALSGLIGGGAAIGSGALQVAGAAANPMQAAMQNYALYGKGDKGTFNYTFNPTSLSLLGEVWTGKAEKPFSQWYYTSMLEEMSRYQEKYAGGEVPREQTLEEWLKTQTSRGFELPKGIHGFEKGMKWSPGQTGEGRGLTPTEQDKMMTMYATYLGTQYDVSQQAAYQALGIQQQYQIPLTAEKGGGLERLSMMLQQGYPVENLALAMSRGPNMLFGQQQQAAGRLMQKWTQQDKFGIADVQKYEAGLNVYSSFGAIAPVLGQTQSWERAQRMVEVPVTQPAGGGGYTAPQFQSIWGGGPVQGYPQQGFQPLASQEQGTKTVAQDYMKQVTIDLTEQFIKSLAEEYTPTQQAAITQRGLLEQRRYAMGLEWTSPEKFAEEYKNLAPQELIKQSRLDSFQNTIQDVLDNIEKTFQQIGQVLPDMTKYQQMAQQPGGMLALQQVQYQQQVGMNISRQAVIGGLGAKEGTLLAGAFPQMTPEQSRLYQGLFEYDRYKWGQAFTQQPELALAARAGATVTGAGGQQVPLETLGYVGVTPVSPQAPGGAVSPQTGQMLGQYTGLPWGRTSLANMLYSSQTMATKIFGAPETWQGQGYDQGLIEALIAGGTRGGEAYQLNLGYENQLAQFGLQHKQLQLQQWYMPQQFQQQKQGQEINWAQQEWGLQMQERNLALSREYFGASTGLQQQQMTMQRGWQMQDWATQERTRAMQWGWKQEDYQESVRFMTGRERRLAERQFGRETIMHDIEGEQFDKQKKRQKELWALEDERFQLQVEHQEALFALQEENIAKQREFFEQRKGLEEEQFELSQEYWERSMALQEEALGVNEAYAAQMHAVSETMLTLGNHTEDVNGQLSLLNESGFKDLYRILMEIDPVFRNFINGIQSAQAAMQGASAGTGTGTSGISGTSGTISKRQHGGPVSSGLVYEVGEAGPELFKPNTDGTIIPIKDPWGASIVTPGLPQNQQSQTIHLVVQVGDERLLDKILDMVDQEVRR